MPAASAKAAAKAAPKVKVKTAAQAAAPKAAAAQVSGRWTVGSHVVRLSDPEMKEAMAEIKRRIKEEPGFKRSLLQSAGIVNARGKLTKLYSGR